jgi:hypothetical protein
MSEVKVIEKETSVSLSMEQYFEPFEKQALEWTEKVKDLKVTNADQTDLMEQSKEARLELKKIRVAIGHKHKELKEESLRTGRAIDAIKNRLTDLIEPIEVILLENENFIEMEEARLKEALQKERLIAMKALIGKEADTIQWGEMSQMVFDNVKNGYVLAQQEAKRKADEERVNREANEKKEAEDKKLRAIWAARVNMLTPFGMTYFEANQRYSNEEHTITVHEIKTDSDDVFADKCLKIGNEISAKKEKDRKSKEASDKKLKEAKDTAAKAAKELAVKLAEEERINKQKIAEERKAKRAPDKNKLLAFATQIELVQSLEVSSDEAKEIILSAKQYLKKAVDLLRSKANDL